jgi:SAM-dependent methyltransferase
LNYFHTALDHLAARPQLWGFLRRIAENGFHAEHEVIARELAPQRDPGARTFIDFGCGTGEFATQFPPESYVGFDVAPHYVTYAGRTRRGRYAVMSGDGLGFADQSFDAGLVLGVFHHMPDSLVRASIAELYRVLRPHATLLIMEDIPSPRIWNIPGHLMHWLDRGDHIRTADDYRALFAPFFSIERSYPIRSGVCDLAVYVTRRTPAMLHHHASGD